MSAATASEIRRIQRNARLLNHSLTAVAVGALAFSTVNVALLAIDHGIPPWVAWMLEPLVGIALWAVLSSDAVLSRYGVSAGVWAWLLRAFTGLVTLTLNVWSSLFTTRPDASLALAPDPAGILLHAIAPLLLILLAEAAPRYRAQFAAITAQLQAAPQRPDTPPHLAAGAGPEADPTTHQAAPQRPDPTAPSPSTSPSTPHGTEPDSGPHSPPRSKKQRRRRARNDARARAILRSKPDITGAELARRLGVQTRSGRRILHRVTAQHREETTR